MSIIEDYLSLPTSDMEKIIARFDERVNEAQAASPASKEWVRKALRREGAVRPPVRAARLSLDVIVKYGDALADLFCEYPDDVLVAVPYNPFVGYQPESEQGVSVVEVLMRDAQWKDEWGVTWGHAYGGVGATPVDHPLTAWSELDEFIATKVPDSSDGARLAKAARSISEYGRGRYTIGYIHFLLFERLQAIRGMQNLFLDLYSNEADVRKLADAICGFLIGYVRQWAGMGADAVMMTEDWGTQTGLMISPTMWRDLFKPYYRRVFDEIHSLGMDVIFHSCGQVTEIIEDLIELGLDVIDPIQPGAMDMEEVARRFGGRVSFSGALDLQNLISSSSPAKIKSEVRRAIDTLGKPFGNGFLVGPSNVLTPEAPIENLRALVAACYGT